MKRAIMTAPGVIELGQVDSPRPGDGQVLMRTERIGICGSDIHVFHGKHPYTRYPVIQGHEVSGIVAAVGDNVDSVAVGDRMTFTPQIKCGTCYPCRHGLYNVCEQLKVMGFQADGAAQEYLVLPDWNVVKVPDEINIDHAAMIEPVAVAVHAVAQGGDVEGKKVLVLGAGTIGNLVAQVALASGAESVMITDTTEYKLEHARNVGIDAAINSARNDLAKELGVHFGPDRADLILECVGSAITAAQAIECARNGTTVVIVGVHGEKPPFNLGYVQDHELYVVGSAMYRKDDFLRAIELMTSGRMSLDALVTHRFAFDDYLQAYQAIERANGECMKVMVEVA